MPMRYRTERQILREITGAPATSIRSVASVKLHRGAFVSGCLVRAGANARFRQIRGIAPQAIASDERSATGIPSVQNAYSPSFKWKPAGATENLVNPLPSE
jgi:hypothetical protein